MRVIGVRVSRVRDRGKGMVDGGVVGVGIVVLLVVGLVVVGVVGMCVDVSCCWW
jgi:hypothetical protein